METDLTEELRFHIELQIAEKIAAGMMPDDARRAALSELGGIEQIKEECRDMRQTQWFEAALQDARFSFRTFRERPAFTPSAIAILAVGIGSATAVFSIVNALFQFPGFHRPIHAAPTQPGAGHAKCADSDRDWKAEGKSSRRAK